MKKKLFLCLMSIGLLLTGCDLFINAESKNFDNKNIVEVEGKDGYYTDPDLSFCAEIRGSYKSDRPFTLDSSNENLRIWDNMYLYEYDYFQMIVNNSPTIFYSVENNDLEFVTVEDRLAEAIIKEGKSGIYKITFDLSTKIFDLEFKSEITNPVYEKMDGCDIYSLSQKFKEMIINPNNPDEYMIKNFVIETGELISFYNHGNVHLSNYKVFLDEQYMNKYASALETGDKHILFAIGGTYDIYVNPISYLVRIELVDKLNADYTLIYYNADGTCTTIEKSNSDLPYIFTYQVTAEKDDRLPIYASSCYMMYELEVIESEYINSLRKIKVAGVYDVEINLDTFTISVTYIS